MSFNMLKLFLAGLALAMLGGCQNMKSGSTGACDVTQNSSVMTAAEKKLSYGVLTYEEGNYQASTVALQGVLETGLSKKPERLRAYKYLAFIECVSGRETTCREYFKKALELDANFNLDSTEAGHPLWGPAFRGVKSKFSK